MARTKKERETWWAVERSWHPWYLAHSEDAARWFAVDPRAAEYFFRLNPAKSAPIRARLAELQGGAA